MAAVDFARWRTTTRYDFVAANLVTHDLLMFGPKLTTMVNPGKFLAMSGISLKNLSKIKRSFRQQPLRLLKTASGKEWAALLYQREGG
jgi:ribosomal protein L11 methylase PrmA